MLRSSILPVVLLLATAASRVAAQSEPSPTLEEARAVGFVEALRSGDADSVVRYMQANWIPARAGDDRRERWAGMAARLIRDHPGLKITGLLAGRPGELQVVTHDSDDTELAFVFTFEPESPNRIAALEIKLGGPGPEMQLPPLAIPGGLGLDGLHPALEQWFAELAHGDLFSGAALIAQDGQPLFSGAWGLASKRWGVANLVDTRFDLGSINKSFTQVAIGQLCAQGKLNLDDPVIAHLPDYPNADVARRVTVRQLLQHTSGLGDIFNDRFFQSSRSLYRSPEDYFPLFADRPLQFEPGQGQAYSNAGYMVLGAIIARVSGEPYDEYINRHIFAPAQMIRSGFFAADDPVAGVAEGYTTVGDEPRQDDRATPRRYRSNVLMLPARGSSAGGAHSCVADLLKFDNALREHRLLSPAWTAWYFGAPAPLSEAADSTSASRELSPMGIAGGAPGVSADLESDGRLTVIVLSNYDPPAAEAIAQELYRVLKARLDAGD
jgi:CubicO group peptidase (beta-lactamase class C family)